MKVIVTGGCGFVGAHLVRRLLADEHQVMVVDNFMNAGPERLPSHPALIVREIDIRDGNALSQAFGAFRPECVFHLAAIHFIPYCNAHPTETLDVNVAGTQRVLEAARLTKASRVIAVSTAAVYPPYDAACPETLPQGPVDVYGYSKWLTEAILERHSQGGDITAIAVRLFNVYGPGETNPHVIPHIMEQLHQGDAINLGSLSSQRDYIYTADVVAGFMSLLAADLANPYLVVNLGTGEAHSVQDILDTLSDILGRPVRAQSKEQFMRKADRPLLLADRRKILALTGWEPVYTLREGLSGLLIEEGLLEG